MINTRTKRRPRSSASAAFWLAFTTLAGFQLVGCSTGGSEPNAATTSTVNNPPVIGGSPELFVVRDQPYFFSPTASDPDGDTLTFSITSQPSWANFDTSNGTLSGTPRITDVGVTLVVTITASDDDASVSLAPFDLEVLEIPPGSATVFWNVPTTNADGSPLTDLAGFRVRYGTASQNYTAELEVNDATAESLLIEDLAPATYFFVVTAFDRSENESAVSLEVSKLIAP